MKIFHHNDPDGRLSAFLISRLADEDEWERNHPQNYIEMDYNTQYDLTKIEKDEHVYIVDFSFKPEQMDFLENRTRNIIWIDHHKSAIEQHKHRLDNTNYLLEDRKKAACELVWEFYHGLRKARMILKEEKERKFKNPIQRLLHRPPEIPKQVSSPLFVNLVGDYDTWTFLYRDMSKHFRKGLDLYPQTVQEGIWSTLYQEWEDAKTVDKKQVDDTLGKILLAGEAILKYEQNTDTEIRKRAAYRISNFYGHSALVINTPKLGSDQFGPDVKEDLMICWHYNGKQYRFGLYSKPGGVDVSEIARQMGGGGHPGAAGAYVDQISFELQTDLLGSLAEK